MMNSMTRITAVLGLTATPLLAETMVEDTDSSGSFSMKELTVSYPELTEALFMEMDVDASGEVSPEELTAAVDAGLIEE